MSRNTVGPLATERTKASINRSPTDRPIGPGQGKRGDRPKYRVQTFPKTYCTVPLNSVQTDLGDEAAGGLTARRPSESPIEQTARRAPSAPLSIEVRPEQGEAQPRVIGSDRTVEPIRYPDGEPASEVGICAAIAKCTECGISFFGGVNQTGRALTPAYHLYMLMFTGGTPVIDVVVAHPDFLSRTRGPRRSNLALIAVNLTAAPKTERQAKWCSEWANVLSEAAHQGVQPEDFADWSAGVTLKQCKADERMRRKAVKLEQCAPPESIIEQNSSEDRDDDVIGAQRQPDSLETQLEIRLIKDNKTECSHTFDLDKIAFDVVLDVLRAQLEPWNIDEAFAAISQAFIGDSTQHEDTDDFRI